ncbi:hypothetical protein Vretimale_1716 [Volvox reticuliferus]|uniref:Uncharacterized protein n=1 Tax=Volvox reticuliferus TaxID=1737510 RepID=A0A8J4D4W3_9CHLO|nr:hypothetical protein Vretifemale_15420 [Volvox reticuliferus]GIL95767.1 hypothetical protein Vretimale_1716 [Volvox reticuliferus]
MDAAEETAPEQPPRYNLRLASPREDAFLVQRAIADGQVAVERGAGSQVADGRDFSITPEADDDIESLQSLMRWPTFTSRALGSFAQFEYEFRKHLSIMKFYGVVQGKKALLVHGFPCMVANICKERYDPFTEWAEKEHLKILHEHKQLWVQAGHREADYEGLEFVDDQGNSTPDLYIFYLAKVKAKFDIPDPDAKWKVQNFWQQENETLTQAAQRFTDLVRCMTKGAISDHDLATHYFDGLRDEQMRIFIELAHMREPVGQMDTWSLKFVMEQAQQYYVSRRISRRANDMPVELKKAKAMTLNTREWQEFQEFKEWQASRKTQRESNTTTRDTKPTAVGTSSQPLTTRTFQSTDRRSRGTQGRRREHSQRHPVDGRPCMYAKCLGRRAAHSEAECWTKQLDEGHVNNQAPPPAYFVEKHKQARSMGGTAMFTVMEEEEEEATTLTITKAHHT